MRSTLYLCKSVGLRVCEIEKPKQREQRETRKILQMSLGRFINEEAKRLPDIFPLIYHDKKMDERIDRQDG